MLIIIDNEFNRTLLYIIDNIKDQIPKLLACRIQIFKKKVRHFQVFVSFIIQIFLNPKIII